MINRIPLPQRVEEPLLFCGFNLGFLPNRKKVLFDTFTVRLDTVREQFQLLASFLARLDWQPDFVSWVVTWVARHNPPFGHLCRWCGSFGCFDCV